ncbi:MAG: GNAT family N-acetyltransferase [Methanomassiliicoccales archaeon]|nr:MAG: GNAT family N-acetyltransferase [Methanomassiliicoccales archaeon]
MAEVPIVKPKDINLQTHRFILRPLTEDDAGDLYKNVKEYDIARWLVNLPYPYPDDGAIKYIKQCQELMKKGESYELAIQLKSTEEVIGVMAFVRVDKKHKNAELGYWTAKKYWSQGIATEAGMRILEFGFDVLNLERIYSKCFCENTASKRVMEKLGMAYEGKSRHEVFKENRFIDLFYYAIIREDWETGR